MQEEAERAERRRSVATRTQSEALVAEVRSVMAELGRVLDTESAHLAAGRIGDGLAQAQVKSDLAAAYMRALETCKANAVALARLAPEAVRELRHDHEAFRRRVERSQAVIATARAVSESLVKSLAAEVDRVSRPRGYAPPTAAPARRANAAPLVFSRQF